MPDPRNDEQRRRLADEYARKAEAELEILANQGASLTDLAREVLRAELLRRGLNISVSEIAEISDSPPLLPIVRVYRDLPDSLIAQSVLDSAGIDCFLFDENIVRLNWLQSYAVRGIKLRVPNEDALDAAQLLEQPRLESFDIGGVGNYVEPQCPNCQSLDVSFRPLIKPMAYGLLIFNLAVTAKHPAWRCAACRHQWRTGEPGEHAPLNWTLIRFLWIVGLAFDFASLIDRYRAQSSWFWWSYTAISAVCLARYAVDRNFTHAFLVGLIVDGWGFLTSGLYNHQFSDTGLTILVVPLIGYNALIAGAIGGMGLMALTWFATFVVPERKPHEDSPSAG